MANDKHLRMLKKGAELVFGENGRTHVLIQGYAGQRILGVDHGRRERLRILAFNSDGFSGMGLESSGGLPTLAPNPSRLSPCAFSNPASGFCSSPGGRIPEREGVRYVTNLLGLGGLFPFRMRGLRWNEALLENPSYDNLAPSDRESFSPNLCRAPGRRGMTTFKNYLAWGY